MHVLVTGANGFIGKNLLTRLKELDIEYSTFTRDHSLSELPDLVSRSEFVVHLAGENRPVDERDFETNNTELTAAVCAAIRNVGRKIPIIFAGSIHAAIDNSYGRSKLAAEQQIERLEAETGNPAYVYRLPGVFGKWSKPNYNSVVATFCHNVSQDLPIEVNDPQHELTLVYVEDVVSEFIEKIQNPTPSGGKQQVTPEHAIKLGQLADLIKAFKESRNTLVTEEVGTGFARKLHATYLSYLRPEQFSYSVPSYGDERGIFAEVLKTKESGQFSFFTANPGVTRGGHYHHTKTEKFLVVKGEARFGFRHLITNEKYELHTNDTEMTVVETVPGWVHNITNVGTEKMVVMLWANEIFDPQKPDTIANPV
jgi:UDP-2-acetamido-2,6-beta-L-arabino-hexul-4-ose reductase